MGLQLKVTSDVLAAAKVWNFPVNNRHKFQCILDELYADNMDSDYGV